MHRGVSPAAAESLERMEDSVKPFQIQFSSPGISFAIHRYGDRFAHVDRRVPLWTLVVKAVPGVVA